jgi:hypothetical protein
MRRAVLLVFVALAGCAQVAQTFKNQPPPASLQAFVGGSESNLIRSWGVPQRTYGNDQHRFLEYIVGQVGMTYGEPLVAPGGVYTPLGEDAQPFGGGMYNQLVDNRCDTIFEVVAGKVVSVSRRGSCS